MSVRIIRVNHLRPPVVIAVAEAEEPPATLTISYPGDEKKAPPGTMAVKQQAIYINTSRLPQDLREACIKHLTAGN